MQPAKPSWISHLPKRMQPYVQLARLEKPAGFMLLLFPAWWAQILATPLREMPNGVTFILFFIGAVVMRAAGCAINDLYDRSLDAQVARTKNRPLASGDIRPWQAVVFALLLCGIGLLIVMHMGALALWLSIAALPLIALYPFMKRITWWPQAFLGLVFNWGALIGFAAVAGTLPLEAFVLYAACFFWTLSYDTIYAFQDKKDDAAVGIKSTALLLDKKAKKYVGLWFGLAYLLLLVAGTLSGLGIAFYLCMGAALNELLAQLKNWNMDDAISSRHAFESNVVFGFVVLAAMLLGHALP